jgi:hypothetical protein
MIAVALAAALAAPATLPREETFRLAQAAEVAATLHLRCDACDWGRRGQEAAALVLEVDGGYGQHLVLARGSGEYRVALGPLAAGEHVLRVALDARASAQRAREVSVEGVVVQPMPPGSPEETALAHAPVLYLRPDTLPRFTDLPLLAWYETDHLADGGVELRYSVVFSNEDGGTPPDRLLATWGRLTDIEFVYGVELDAAGRVRAERYQAEGHELRPFAGRHQGRHPLLWVTTANNMLSEGGAGTLRVAPAPVAFALKDVSREAVMDAHPWTWRVSAAEARREGRVRAAAALGSKRILDPRRYLYLEACAEAPEAALAFAAGLRGAGGAARWVWSDGGALAWRVARSADHFPNGCFRAAVPLPAGRGADDLVGLRFRSHLRARRQGEPAPPPGAGNARLLRINRITLLGADDLPGPPLFSWVGDLSMTAEGPPVEVPVPGPGALQGSE